MTKRLYLIGFCLLLAGCGPLIGLGSKMADGIGKVTVTGDATTLRGGDLLVYAPFAKTDRAFYICRGEEARNFADELQRRGLFTTDLYFERTPGKEETTAAELRKLNGAEIKARLGLEKQPQRILFGTFVSREESAVPLRGVVMETVYRLEFFDVASRASTVFEIEAHFLTEEMIANVVAELGRRIGR